jgi:L-ascorbate metabolism protein UlaG (beta-lactamase superfamily)
MDKDIKKQLGEMDICLMPTTAWFQRHWHFAPEDAVQAAEDLGCRTLIPWRWGTWVNSFEHILDEPYVIMAAGSPRLRLGENGDLRLKPRVALHLSRYDRILPPRH